MLAHAISSRDGGGVEDVHGNNQQLRRVAQGRGGEGTTAGQQHTPLCSARNTAMDAACEAFQRYMQGTLMKTSGEALASREDAGGATGPPAGGTGEDASPQEAPDSGEECGGGTTPCVGRVEENSPNHERTAGGEAAGPAGPSCGEIGKETSPEIVPSWGRDSDDEDSDGEAGGLMVPFTWGPREDERSKTELNSETFEGCWEKGSPSDDEDNSDGDGAGPDDGYIDEDEDKNIYS